MISRRSLASIAAGIALSGILALPRPAKADQLEEARSFVSSVIEQGVRNLTGKNIDETERRKRFLEFLYRYADSPNVEQSLLGRYWDRLTEPQRATYRKLLEEYVVLSYGDDLSDFDSDEHIDVLGAEATASGIVVHSLDVDPTDPPPSRVDWILVVRPNGFKIVDVAFDGVSAAATLRDDFVGTIRNAGGKVEALFAAMEAKIAMLKATPQKK